MNLPLSSASGYYSKHDDPSCVVGGKAIGGDVAIWKGVQISGSLSCHAYVLWTNPVICLDIIAANVP